MANKFEDGTLVQLKSGGPVMTVESHIKDSDKYCCEWFKDGKRYNEVFRETSIEEYVPSIGIF